MAKKSKLVKIEPEVTEVTEFTHEAENVDAGLEAVSLLFKGKFYSGADGLGGFLKVKAGQEVIVSQKIADGILESWPTEWEVI